VLLEDGEDVLEEIELFVARARKKSSRLITSDSFACSPASFTMVTLLFLPKGGLARTIWYSPCFPASASFVTTGKSSSDWQPAGIFTQARKVVQEDLTPGTTYDFQFRAHGGSTGASDWSDPISHMAT